MELSVSTGSIAIARRDCRGELLCGETLGALAPDLRCPGGDRQGHLRTGVHRGGGGRTGGQHRTPGDPVRQNLFYTERPASTPSVTRKV